MNQQIALHKHTNQNINHHVHYSWLTQILGWIVNNQTIQNRLITPGTYKWCQKIIGLKRSQRKKFGASITTSEGEHSDSIDEEKEADEAAQGRRSTRRSSITNYNLKPISAQLSRSPSPVPQVRGRSPVRKNRQEESRSPVRDNGQLSPSPVQKKRHEESRSPVHDNGQQSPSPVRKKRQESTSPESNRDESPSPVRKKSRSPGGKQPVRNNGQHSPSPVRKKRHEESRSAVRDNRQQSPSPVRNGQQSPSPVRKKSRSPGRKHHGARKGQGYRSPVHTTPIFYNSSRSSMSSAYRSRSPVLTSSQSSSRTLGIFF